MTEKELAEQIKALQRQITALRAEQRRDVKPKRKILPDEIREKYDDVGWNGYSYSLSDLYPNRQIIELSDIVRRAVTKESFTKLIEMDDDVYRKYSKCLDEVISVLMNYAGK